MTFTLCHNFIILLFRRHCYTFPSSAAAAAAHSARKFSGLFLSHFPLFIIRCRSRPNALSLFLKRRNFLVFFLSYFSIKQITNAIRLGWCVGLSSRKTYRKLFKNVYCVWTQESTQCTNYWTNKRAALHTVWRVRARTRFFLFGFEKRFSRHVNSLLFFLFHSE